jgi:hypothetical protein
MSRKAQREESDDQKMRIPTSPMGRLRTTVPEDDACVQKKGLENHKAECRGIKRIVEQQNRGI